MGHTRLGRLPTTKKWKAVVATISSVPTTGLPIASAHGPSVDVVARQSVDAAKEALEAALEDDGLNYTFFMLTQLALASRGDDWRERLGTLGIELQTGDGFFDLLSEFQGRIDAFVFERERSSDISEMAMQAAGEALASLSASRAQTLFGEDLNTVRAAIRPLSTLRGFADLGQEFFGSFMARFLNFYVSRATAAHVGSGQLPLLGDLTVFNDALRKHCKESALIVRDFSGEWYSKTEYQQGITLENTKRFLAVAIEKLRAELARQRDE